VIAAQQIAAYIWVLGWLCDAMAAGPVK